MQGMTLFQTRLARFGLLLAPLFWVFAYVTAEDAPSEIMRVAQATLALGLGIAVIWAVRWAMSGRSQPPN